MLRNSILRCSCFMLSPFGGGGNFDRAKANPRMMIMEMRIELEEVRTRRRQLQEKVQNLREQMVETKGKDYVEEHRNVYAWLTGAAIVLIFGLLFSTGALLDCGACGSFGFSGLCILIAVILGLRAWGEYMDLMKDKRNASTRIGQCAKECEMYNVQIYKLNQREAELDEAIRAAQRYY